MAAIRLPRVEVAAAGPYSLVQCGDYHVFTVEDRRGIGIRPRVVTSFTPDGFAHDQYRVRGADGESELLEDPVAAFTWWVDHGGPT